MIDIVLTHVVIIPAIDVSPFFGQYLDNFTMVSLYRIVKALISA